jgi:biotin operon repressor
MMVVKILVEFNFRIRNTFEFDERVRLSLSGSFSTAREILHSLGMLHTQSNVRKVSSAVERLRRQGFTIIADRGKGYKIGLESPPNSRR